MYIWRKQKDTIRRISLYYYTYKIMSMFFYRLLLSVSASFSLQIQRIRHLSKCQKETRRKTSDNSQRFSRGFWRWRQQRFTWTVLLINVRWMVVLIWKLLKQPPHTFWKRFFSSSIIIILRIWISTQICMPTKRTEILKG